MKRRRAIVKRKRPGFAMKRRRAAREADASPAANAKERMSQKLRTPKGRATYAQRKQIVEPVFGQIKEVQRFRRFSFRGLVNVTHEWSLVCLTHNLLKLFRSDWRPQTA